MRNKILTAMICGGIGNQLFCYAHAYSYAKRNDLSLQLDLLDYDSGYFRKYQLNRLKIQVDYVIHHSFPPSIIYRTRKFLIPLKYQKYIREQRPYYYQFVPDANSAYMEGYWQSQKYFAGYENDLQQKFRLKKLEDIKKLETFSKALPMNSVAIHIRRGDFKKGGCCLDIQYYEKAIDYILAQVENPYFILFSDDLEWVKNCFLPNYKKLDMVISNQIYEINDDLITIFAIASCKHQIIANSTYSWWGAMLNINVDKIIVAPMTDYLKGTHYYPQNWIKLFANLQK